MAPVVKSHNAFVSEASLSLVFFFFRQAFVEKHHFYHNHLASAVEDPESKARARGAGPGSRRVPVPNSLGKEARSTRTNYGTQRVPFERSMVFQDSSDSMLHVLPLLSIELM